MGGRFRALPRAGQRPCADRRGGVAAGELLALFNDVVPDTTDNLLTILAREARRVGCDEREIIVANGIGFLFQAYDATAGLIGNTLLALASHHEVYAQLTADPNLLGEVIDEVLRYDPPVQNTRRFVASGGELAGQIMDEGDRILVILAAASRDPSINPHPARFDLSRKDRRTFTFGTGVHACPGAPLATIIARAGLAHLLAMGADLMRLTNPVIYRPSQNVRIALAPSGQ